MGEYLSPGLFIEEVPSNAQTIAGVSTSNGGFAGTLPQGPAHEATLVGSYPEFERTFGGMTKESKTMCLTLAAFFANGGQRAFIVRVPRSDADAADARVQVPHVDFPIGYGDPTGVAVTYTSESGTGIAGAFVGLNRLPCGDGFAPVLPHSAMLHPFKIRWRPAAAAPVLPAVLRNRGSSANVACVAGTAKYEGRILPASLPTYDAALMSVVPGTVTLEWKGALRVAKTQLLATPADGEFVSTTTTGAGSVITFDYSTTRISILFAGADIPSDQIAPPDPIVAGDLTLGFTPAGATVEITAEASPVAPHAEVHPRIYLADAIPGSVVEAAGPLGAAPYDHHTAWAWAGGLLFKAVAAAKPHAGAPIVADFTTLAWDLTPSSVGAWANGVKVAVSGSPNWYDQYTGYSKFDVYVKKLNTETLAYDVIETFEELVFDDPDDASYFPDVLNDLSDYVNVGEPGGDEAPLLLLNGPMYEQVLGGGDETAGNQIYAATLLGAVGALSLQPHSVKITWVTPAGVAKLIYDDGEGALVGDVDGTVVGSNTIDYDTGAVAFVTSGVVGAGTLVTAFSRTEPAETEHEELFGDTAKQISFKNDLNTATVNFFAAGDDGSVALTRADISEAAGLNSLEANEEGMYALNQTDELMQIALPEFAGDVTVYGDVLDYCEKRRDRYAILVTPSGLTGQQAANWFQFTFKRYSKFAAIYWPWIKLADPMANSRPLVFPPFGHIAGIYARTDVTKNVGKSPGGISDGQLRFLLGLERKTSQAERDYVYPRKINPLIDTPYTGMAVWGVRQIALESEWKYINSRRLFMFVEKSVFNAMHWVIFENNGNGLWTRIRVQLVSFLTNLFNSGYFAGASPSEAFFVICDETNNTQASIDAGLVYVDIGIAPNRPAEFVVFRFQQKTTGA